MVVETDQIGGTIRYSGLNALNMLSKWTTCFAPFCEFRSLIHESIGIWRIAYGKPADWFLVMWDLQDINWDFKKLLLLCQYQSPWNDTGLLMPIPIHQGKTNPQHSTRLGYEYQLISDS
jgi:hypothetical protein